MNAHPESFEYDPYEFRRPRKKRVSKITGRETSLREETELQIACTTYYEKMCRVDRNMRLNTRFFAIAPNDGKRPVQQAALAKRMGQKRGPWDGQFYDRRSGKLVLTWVEFKALDGSLTDEQRDYQQFLFGTPIRFVEIRSQKEWHVFLEGA